MVCSAFAAAAGGGASSVGAAPASVPISAPSVLGTAPSAAAAAASPAAASASSSSGVPSGKVLGINSALASAVSADEQNFVANGGNPQAFHPPNLHQAPPLSETHGVVTPLYSVAPAPLGVAYYGISNTTGTLQGSVVNSTSLAGTWATTDPLATAAELFDTSSGNAAGEFGAQENAVLVNVTLKGQTSFPANPNAPSGCPTFPNSACPNQFWLQNYIEYTEGTHGLQVGDEIWNFSNPTADWASSQSGGTNTIAGFGSVQDGELYALSGSGYAFSVTVAPPFSLVLYMNYTQGPCHTDSVAGTGIPSCGVVSTTEPVNELFMNYTIRNAAGQRVCPSTEPTGRVCGEYDDVFFNSVGTSNPSGVPLYGPRDAAGSYPAASRVGSATIQANGTGYDPVGLTNDFEMDYGIGSDDGATNNIVYQNGIVGIDYCPNANVAHTATGSISCTTYSATPSAVDYGGETGETSTGEMAYWQPQGTAGPGPSLLYGAAQPIVHLSTGPSLLVGLWNMTGSTYTGSAPYPAYEGGEPLSYANIAPANAWVGIAQDQSPGQLVTSQFYFQVAPTFGWFSYWKGSGGAQTATTLGANLWLPTGWYTIEVLLSGYAPVIEQIDLTSPMAPSITLTPDYALGAYTPDWAFSNGDLANLSVSSGNAVPTGAGTTVSPYLISAPAPTVSSWDGVVLGVPGSVSWLFSNLNDYLFTQWIGGFINSTTAVTQFNPAPSFLITYPSWQLGALAEFNVPSTDGFQYYLLNTQNLAVIGATQIYAWANSEATTLYSFVVNNGANDLVAGNTFTISNRGIEFINGGTTSTFTINGNVVTPVLKDTRNVVWGNTFLPYPQTTYTGLEPFTAQDSLVASEAFDRVYNNGFEAYSSTVNATASAGSTDTTWWNVTCQAGFTVALGASYPGTTVCQPASYSQSLDGLALTGSYLHGNYQGGNFWAGYGNAANLYGAVPYKARLTSPSGTAEIASTVAGFAGDYAPLIPGTVYKTTFTETGLTTGNSWGIRIAAVPVYQAGSSPTLHSNILNTTTVSATLLTNSAYLPNGTYSWTLASHTSPSIASVSSGVITVNGGTVSVTLPFQWPVEFTESGLPLNTQWAVTFNGRLSIGSGHSQNVSAGPGTYAYSVAAIPNGWIATPSSGTETVVAGTTEVVTVAFTASSATTYAVYFTASSLPSGTPWQVWLNSTDGGSNYHQSGSTATLSVSAKADTYTYQVGAITGFTSSVTTPASGSLTVTNVPMSVGITFSSVTYTVTFTESGLPGATAWGVSFGGVFHWSSGTSISFQVAAGTYAWQVSYVSGYYVSSQSTTSPTTVSGTTPISIGFSVV